ncbi:hypothetical protein L6259_03745 [Candidatus Parcubacteria bacterium]|nr:hypothetical protein [Patescibacteria group bacterium]MCG2694349.1 hypothetical protein [Candidatus Parcubacteria bacterium]
MTFENPPKGEEKPEENLESPEMAAEEEISPEAMEANEYFEGMRAQMLELEIKGELTPEEQETLDYLKEQVELFDELGGEIEEIIEE